MNSSLKAYSRASHTVGKTRQVVMLYDGAIRFMKQAIEAIEAKDYETRYNKITRVSEILMGLQACLDFEAGGDSAKVLYDFYSMMDLRLFTIHRSNSIEECNAVIARLKEMRDTWDAIDRGNEVNTPAQNSPAAGNDPVIVSA